MKTFKYLMEAYFYQEWMSEYSDANDIKVLILFANNENLKTLNDLINDIEHILENDMADCIFNNNDFDFNPLTSNYESRTKWFKTAYKTLAVELKRRVD